jgi:hypothetical protein
MEEEKEYFARHRKNWEFSFSHGRFAFDVISVYPAFIFRLLFSFYFSGQLKLRSILQRR